MTRGGFGGPAFGELLGREDALARLDEATRTARVVSIVGAPGIGKSHLLAEWWERRRDAVYFDLSDCASPEDVLALVASRFPGAWSEGPGSPEGLARALEAEGLRWVIFDSGDRLVRPHAHVLEYWLAGDERLRLVVASRQRLAATGEAVLVLPPLAPDDAVALFFRRVALLRPGVQETAAERQEAARLVTMLDGLPLAIELAASRVRVLGVRQMVTRLESGIDLLSSPLGAGPGRLSLRDTIDASLELLSADEARAFAEVSVFRGGFSLDAARAVLSPPREPGRSVTDVLGALVDASLLQRDGERYATLAPLREHGASRLVAGDTGGVTRERHAAYYAELAEPPRFQEDEPARTSHERGNLAIAFDTALACAAEAPEIWPSRAARLALELASFATRDASSVAARERLVAVLAGTRASLLAPDLRARALVARSFFAYCQGEPEDADDYREALSIALSIRSPEIALHALRRLAVLAQRTGQIAEAIALAERAVAVASKADDACVRRAETLLAHVLLAAGRFERVIAVLARASADAGQGHGTEDGALVPLGTMLGFRAIALHELGRFDEASRDYGAAIALYDRAAADRFAAETCAEAAVLALECGRPDDAERWTSRARDALARSPDAWLQGRLTELLGIAAELRGDLTEARRLHEQRLVRVRRAGEPHAHGLAALHLARVLARLGEHEQATALLDRAEALLAEHEQPLSPLHRALLGAAVCVTAGDHTALSPVRALRAEHPADLGAVPLLEARMALRHLDALLLAAAAETSRGVARAGVAGAPSLPLEPEAGWLVLSRSDHAVTLPTGVRVDLGRKRACWAMLLALAEARASAPGEPLGVEELHRVAWPGERIHGTSGKQRVYTTLWELRKLGCGDVVQRDKAGYVVPVALAVMIR